MAPQLTQYQATSQSPLPQQGRQKKDDWRLLSQPERHEVVHVLSPDEIMRKYGVSKATAYNWKSKTV